MDLASVIRNVPDFPKAGVQFKDITTLLQNPEAFRFVIDSWRERYASQDVDVIVGVDARGFLFGAALAYAMGLPFVMARKKGKLPGPTIEEDFELEYGTGTVEIQTDAFEAGHRVLIADDLLATGGTVSAVVNLIRRLEAEVVEAAFVIELPPLGGREKLADISVHSLVEFMVE